MKLNTKFPCILEIESLHARTSRVYESISADIILYGEEGSEKIVTVPGSTLSNTSHFIGSEVNVLSANGLLVSVYSKSASVRTLLGTSRFNLLDLTDPSGEGIWEGFEPFFGGVDGGECYAIFRLHGTLPVNSTPTASVIEAVVSKTSLNTFYVTIHSIRNLTIKKNNRVRVVIDLGSRRVVSPTFSNAALIPVGLTYAFPLHIDEKSSFSIVIEEELIFSWKPISRFALSDDELSVFSEESLRCQWLPLLPGSEFQEVSAQGAGDIELSVSWRASELFISSSALSENSRGQKRSVHDFTKPLNSSQLSELLESTSGADSLHKLAHIPSSNNLGSLVVSDPVIKPIIPSESFSTLLKAIGVAKTEKLTLGNQKCPYQLHEHYQCACAPPSQSLRSYNQGHLLSLPYFMSPALLFAHEKESSITLVQSKMLVLLRFDGGRFHSVQPHSELPPSHRSVFERLNSSMLSLEVAIGSEVRKSSICHHRFYKGLPFPFWVESFFMELLGDKSAKEYDADKLLYVRLKTSNNIILSEKEIHVNEFLVGRDVHGNLSIPMENSRITFHCEGLGQLLYPNVLPVEVDVDEIDILTNSVFTLDLSLLAITSTLLDFSQGMSPSDIQYIHSRFSNVALPSFREQNNPISKSYALHRSRVGVTVTFLGLSDAVFLDTQPQQLALQLCLLDGQPISRTSFIRLNPVDYVSDEENRSDDDDDDKDDMINAREHRGSSQSRLIRRRSSSRSISRKTRVKSSSSFSCFEFSESLQLIVPGWATGLPLCLRLYALEEGGLSSNDVDVKVNEKKWFPSSGTKNNNNSGSFRLSMESSAVLLCSSVITFPSLPWNSAFSADLEDIYAKEQYVLHSVTLEGICARTHLLHALQFHNRPSASTAEDSVSVSSQTTISTGNRVIHQSKPLLLSNILNDSVDDSEYHNPLSFMKGESLSQILHALPVHLPPSQALSAASFHLSSMKTSDTAKESKMFDRSPLTEFNKNLSLQLFLIDQLPQLFPPGSNEYVDVAVAIHTPLHSATHELKNIRWGSLNNNNVNCLRDSMDLLCSLSIPVSQALFAVDSETKDRNEKILRLVLQVSPSAPKSNSYSNSTKSKTLLPSQSISFTADIPIPRDPESSGFPQWIELVSTTCGIHSPSSHYSITLKSNEEKKRGNQMGRKENTVQNPRIDSINSEKDMKSVSFCTCTSSRVLLRTAVFITTPVESRPIERASMVTDADSDVSFDSEKEFSSPTYRKIKTVDSSSLRSDIVGSVGVNRTSLSSPAKSGDLKRSSTNKEKEGTHLTSKKDHVRGQRSASASSFSSSNSGGLDPLLKQLGHLVEGLDLAGSDMDSEEREIVESMRRRTQKRLEAERLLLDRKKEEREKKQIAMEVQLGTRGDYRVSSKKVGVRFADVSSIESEYYSTEEDFDVEGDTQSEDSDSNSNDLEEQSKHNSESRSRASSREDPDREKLRIRSLKRKLRVLSETVQMLEQERASLRKREKSKYSSLQRRFQHLDPSDIEKYEKYMMRNEKSSTAKNDSRGRSSASGSSHSRSRSRTRFDPELEASLLEYQEELAAIQSEYRSQMEKNKRRRRSGLDDVARVSAELESLLLAHRAQRKERARARRNLSHASKEAEAAEAAARDAMKALEDFDKHFYGEEALQERRKLLRKARRRALVAKLRARLSQDWMGSFNLDFKYSSLNFSNLERQKESISTLRSHILALDIHPSPSNLSNTYYVRIICNGLAQTFPVSPQGIVDARVETVLFRSALERRFCPPVVVELWRQRDPIQSNILNLTSITSTKSFTQQLNNSVGEDIRALALMVPADVLRVSRVLCERLSVISLNSGSSYFENITWNKQNSSFEIPPLPSPQWLEFPVSQLVKARLFLSLQIVHEMLPASVPVEQGLLCTFPSSTSHIITTQKEQERWPGRFPQPESPVLEVDVNMKIYGLRRIADSADSTLSSFFLAGMGQFFVPPGLEAELSLLIHSTSHHDTSSNEERNHRDQLNSALSYSFRSGKGSFVVPQLLVSVDSVQALPKGFREVACSIPHVPSPQVNSTREFPTLSVRTRITQDDLLELTGSSKDLLQLQLRKVHPLVLQLCNLLGDMNSSNSSSKSSSTDILDCIGLSSIVDLQKPLLDYFKNALKQWNQSNDVTDSKGILDVSKHHSSSHSRRGLSRSNSSHSRSTRRYENARRTSTRDVESASASEIEESDTNSDDDVSESSSSDSEYDSRAHRGSNSRRNARLSQRNRRNVKRSSSTSRRIEGSPADDFALNSQLDVGNRSMHDMQTKGEAPLNSNPSNFNTNGNINQCIEYVELPFSLDPNASDEDDELRSKRYFKRSTSSKCIPSVPTTIDQENSIIDIDNVCKSFSDLNAPGNPFISRFSFSPNISFTSSSESYLIPRSPLSLTGRLVLPFELEKLSSSYSNAEGFDFLNSFSPSDHQFLHLLTPSGSPFRDLPMKDANGVVGAYLRASLCIGDQKESLPFHSNSHSPESHEFRLWKGLNASTTVQVTVSLLGLLEWTGEATKVAVFVGDRVSLFSLTQFNFGVLSSPGYITGKSNRHTASNLSNLSSSSNLTSVGNSFPTVSVPVNFPGESVVRVAVLSDSAASIDVNSFTHSGNTLPTLPRGGILPREVRELFDGTVALLGITEIDLERRIAAAIGSGTDKCDDRVSYSAHKKKGRISRSSEFSSDSSFSLRGAIERRRLWIPGSASNSGVISLCVDIQELSPSSDISSVSSVTVSSSSSTPSSLRLKTVSPPKFNSPLMRVSITVKDLRAVDTVNIPNLKGCEAVITFISTQVENVVGAFMRSKDRRSMNEGDDKAVFLKHLSLNTLISSFSAISGAIAILEIRDRDGAVIGSSTFSLSSLLLSALSGDLVAGCLHSSDEKIEESSYPHLVPDSIANYHLKSTLISDFDLITNSSGNRVSVIDSIIVPFILNENIDMDGTEGQFIKSIPLLQGYFSVVIGEENTLEAALESARTRPPPVSHIGTAAVANMGVSTLSALDSPARALKGSEGESTRSAFQALSPSAVIDYQNPSVPPLPPSSSSKKHFSDSNSSNSALKNSSLFSKTSFSLSNNNVSSPINDNSRNNRIREGENNDISVSVDGAVKYLPPTSKVLSASAPEALKPRTFCC